MRVWLLCGRVWRVDRRLKDDSLCSLSLHGSEGCSSKVLVADVSAPVGRSATIRTVSADETDVEIGDVGEWRNESTRIMIVL